MKEMVWNSLLVVVFIVQNPTFATKVDHLQSVPPFEAFEGERVERSFEFLPQRDAINDSLHHLHFLLAFHEFYFLLSACLTT